jgi:hypothetical protein
LVTKLIMQRLRTKLLDRLLPNRVPASRRLQALLKYPALRTQDVADAKLFARRQDLVEYLAPQLRGGIIAEIGVLFGDFSDFMIRAIEPQLFVAIDSFGMHKVSLFWGGKTSSERFNGMTHREFFEKRFSERGAQVRCEEGDSYDALSKYPDKTFDMIYVDAGHDYNSVQKDADLSKKKLKADGILIFNDYIIYNHFEDNYYGIVPVVNDLVVNQGFEVRGFALQKQMACDIAIGRRREA